MIRSIKTMSIAFILIASLGMAQETPIQKFKEFTKKVWKAQGKWGNQSKFMQTIEFNFALDSAIVIANSTGYTDLQQLEVGQRNHGIRWFDKEQNKILFSEFDVFGGATHGEVEFEGNNVMYRYKYGGTDVTDMWEFVNDSTYNFKVGIYEKGTWKAIFLNTRFKGKQKGQSDD
ncbi:hypothetical protein [Flagellimonas sp. 2504JD1-5]